MTERKEENRDLAEIPSFIAPGLSFFSPQQQQVSWSNADRPIDNNALGSGGGE